MVELVRVTHLCMVVLELLVITPVVVVVVMLIMIEHMFIKLVSSGVGVGIHHYLYTNNSATIPADHDKFRVNI